MIAPPLASFSSDEPAAASHRANEMTTGFLLGLLVGGSLTLFLLWFFDHHDGSGAAT